MIREFQIRQQLGFKNGVHFLYRLVLDDDALGHQHVDAITDLNFDLAVAFLSPSRSSRLGGEKTLQPYCEVAQITQEDCKG